MLKGVLNKGVVKYSLLLIVLVLFFISILLVEPGIGVKGKDMATEAPEPKGKATGNPHLMDFQEIGEEDDIIDEPEIPPEEEPEDEPPATFFIPASSSGSGGGSVQCVDTHKICQDDQCVSVQGPGKDECSTDYECYCKPRTPGYWKNHLTEAESLLECVHDNYDIFDYVETKDNITYVLECSDNCSNMFNKLKKFLLATILNICADNFELSDAYLGKSIDYWIGQSIAEVENGESEDDEYYKNALDSILNGGVDCRPVSHTECNHVDDTCDIVFGTGEDECESFDDCVDYVCEGMSCVAVAGTGEVECTDDLDCTDYVCNYEEFTCDAVAGNGYVECESFEDCEDECILPYLEVDKEVSPEEVVCEETAITLSISGEGEVCPQANPVDVVLIFDNSGSMDDDSYCLEDPSLNKIDCLNSGYRWILQPIGDAKEAAKNFVDLLGKNDMNSLVSFATTANLEVDLTYDHQEVKDAIDSLSATGWTNMSNGIEIANDELVSNGREDVPWIEILLSDGNNNCGTNHPPEDCHQKVFDRAQEAASEGIVIYTIALGEKANQSLMETVSNITGGKFYYAPDSNDLKEIYEEIAGELISTIAGTNVVVMDYLPDYVELNESSLTNECEYNDTDMKITCDVGTLHINETVEISFNVYVHKIGYVLTNIYPDSGVEYVNYNETVVFEKFPETYVTSLDCDHTVCNYVNLTCENVPGPGEDECETFEDCPQHTVCNYDKEACVIVEGPGEDQCLTWDDCIHTECCDMSCMVSDSPGTDECSQDSDCYYYACQDMSCVAVEGSGTDECATDADCTDYVCQDISCVAVAGTGQVECMDDDDCRHYECDYVNELCKVVAEEGMDECLTWDDCLYCGDGEVTPPEECELPGTNDNTYCDQTTSECYGHKLGIRDGYGDCEVCICEYDEFDYSCVEGECGAECDEDTDCPCPKDGCVGPDWYEYPDHGVCTDDCMCDVDETPCDGPCKPSITPDDPRCTRYVCDYVGKTCKFVEGDGVDECSSWNDCVHTECNYDDLTCDTVESQGEDECETFEDCPQHTVCNYDKEACVIVEGPGEDQCLTWDDCIHTECCDMSCVVSDSPGTDECSQDSDCYYYVCEEMSCIAVPGEAPNECETSEDCYYYACDYGFEVCSAVTGFEEDECVTYDDCVHNVCNYQTLTCDVYPSVGTDECVTFDDCPQHTICNYDLEQCLIVQGEGVDQCSTFDDCIHDICDYQTFTCVEKPVTTPGYACTSNSDCFEKICDYDQFVCKKVQPGTPGTSCNTWDDCGFCGNGMIDPGEECEQDSDCACPEDGCDIYNYKYPDYYRFPDYSECTPDTCSCLDCVPVVDICADKCMGNCSITVRLEHDQGNKANYDQTNHNPSGGTYDIWIVVESNGQCGGWRIPIKYWFFQCPGFEPDQADIEYDTWPPKWNRLCTASSKYVTKSLMCNQNFDLKTLTVDLRGGDKGGEVMRFKTDVGIATGTYQIDIRDSDCYVKNAAVALGCAGHQEDNPYTCEMWDLESTCLVNGDNCVWEDAGCAGGDFLCSNIRYRPTCSTAGCVWTDSTETEGDYCRKPYDGYRFDCSDITSRNNCNTRTNGKCSWEEAYCEDAA